MSDLAHAKTDEKLEEMEKWLSAIYSIIPYLNQDKEKLIKRQRRKEGVYGKNRTASERDKREAV